MTPTPTRTATALPPDDAIVELGGLGFDLEVDTARQQLYVSVPGNNEVDVISAKTLEVTDRVAFGGERPYGLDLSLDGSRLFVALNAAGAVGVIDLETMATSEILVDEALGDAHTYDVVEARPNRLYVSASPGSSGFAWLTVVRLDENNAATRFGSIIRADPTFLVSPDMRSLYVGEGFSPNSLYAFDITSDEPTYVHEDVHGSVEGTDRMDISPDGSRIYLSSGQILRSDALTQAAQVYSSGVPRVSPDGTRLYMGKREGESFNSLPEIVVYDREALTETSLLRTSCPVSRLEFMPATPQLAVLGTDQLCIVPIDQ
jgi:DNA-binding beta-propeller fold protein YncE